MKAFYFSNDTKTLRYGDNRTIVVGETHEVEGEIIPCMSGLHASTRMIDALRYAPGSNLYLVALSGTVITTDDKVAASKRTYLAHYDADALLRVFTRKQALINIAKIKPYCSEEDYTLILNYLNTGNEDLRSAAWSAAYSAANSAANSAAGSAAAELAAESAADSAGYSAAWSAASASELAAELAAESAADSAASAARPATWSAAHSAARSAARSAANKMLTGMIAEATGWDIAAEE